MYSMCGFGLFFAFLILPFKSKNNQNPQYIGDVNVDGTFCLEMFTFCFCLQYLCVFF